MISLLRFANIFLGGLNAGISFSHALQAPQKAKLDKGCFVTVQQKLYMRYGRAASALEPGALATSVVIAAARRRQRSAWIPMLVAAACTVGEIAVWTRMIDPINRQIWQWDGDNAPSDWPRVRDRWHSLHRVRAVLCATALGASIVSLLSDSRERTDKLHVRRAA